jgi:hypothetical protein
VARDDKGSGVRRIGAIAILAGLAAEGLAQGAIARVERAQATLTLGATATVNAVTIQPLSIEQDSRCAIGAQCIWAGTVKVKARVGTRSRRSVKILGLAEPMEVAKGRWITLAGVCPAPRLGSPIERGDYRLTFRFGRGNVPPPRGDANC